MKKFVLNIPTERRYWETLRRTPDVEDRFWSEAPFEVVPYEDLTEAIETLVERGRSWSAITIASHGIFNQTADQKKHLPSTALVLSVLRAAIAQEPERAGLSPMTAHHVGTLLDYLAEEDVPAADLASLEFGYFRLLQDDREPRALNQALASDPALFVELVRRTFRGESEPKRPHRSADPQAQHAWWVLRDWRGFPGQQDDGTLDQNTLHEWIEQARRQLSDLDRAGIGDELIGQTFAHTPVDSDGIWPPVAVRDLIESIGSRELERGAIIGRLNSRGVTSRGVYDGGSQERTLAEQYNQWSLAAQVHWRRTASILRAIAESYEREAIREDEQSQLDQDLD